jgi:hypothetical protein
MNNSLIKLTLNMMEKLIDSSYMLTALKLLSANDIL